MNWIKALVLAIVMSIPVGIVLAITFDEPSWFILTAVGFCILMAG